MMNNHGFHAKKSMDANTKSAIMTIDPSFAPSIIGTRGTNVARIQDATGTQIRVSAADGTATIVGTQAGIDAATTMIEQHMDRTSTVEIPFHHDMRELVFGPRGATVRRIEQESGANKVRIDRDRSVIVAIGSKQAAEYVKSFYAKLLADFSASGFTMRVDESLIGLIIGKRGSTVKEIESLSGCSITVSNPGVITLRGSKDAIHNARQMIDEVIRRDEGRGSHGNNAADSVVIPYPPVLFHHFTRRGVDNLSILDGLKLEFPGVASVDIARTAGQITMSGDEEGVAAASEKLHALITEASQFIATFNASQAGARAVIGQGGSTVKDLERQLKVDINVSKSNVVTIYARGGDYALRFAMAEVEKVAAGAR